MIEVSGALVAVVVGALAAPTGDVDGADAEVEPPAESVPSASEEVSAPSQVPAPMVSTPPGVAEASTHEDLAGYESGFFIKSRDRRFALKIGGYLQTQLETHWDRQDPDQLSIRVRRARLKFKGHLYDPKFQYEYEYDFVDSRLLRAILAYEHSSALKLITGQYRVPYNFEGLASSSTQQFADRSLAHAIFGFPKERDIGIMLRGALLDKRLGYFVGVYNGEGINTRNTDSWLLYAGRLTFDVVGKLSRLKGVAFSDPARSDTTALSVGVAGSHENEANEDLGRRQRVTKGVIDVTLIHTGFSAHVSGYYQKTDRKRDGEFVDRGFLGQLGYFVLPARLEVAARAVEARLQEDASEQAEYTVSTNLYLHHGHGIKLHLDLSRLTTRDDSGDETSHENRARLLFQFKI